MKVYIQPQANYNAVCFGFHPSIAVCSTDSGEILFAADQQIESSTPSCARWSFVCLFRIRTMPKKAISSMPVKQVAQLKHTNNKKAINLRKKEMRRLKSYIYIYIYPDEA
jgi:hypothetical protein